MGVRHNDIDLESDLADYGRGRAKCPSANPTEKKS